MKIYLFLFIAATVLPPTLATLPLIWFATIPWSVPKNDVKHVTFPINIANAPHERTYWFSHLLFFKDQQNAEISIGLLPQPDAGPGISVIRAVFEIGSYSIDSTTNVDDNCSPESGGVYCSVDFNGTYANTYNLEVRNTEGTTWNGTAIDTVTKRRIHIGSFTLPVGTGATLDDPVALVRYDYKGEPELPLPHCERLPLSSVVFGVPTTDAGVGSLKDHREEDCKGSDNFKFQKTPDDGIEISIGFPANTAIIRFQHEQD